MADPQFNDDEFADIHHALGIQSTKPEDLIGRHPVLQIVPSGLPVAPASSATSRNSDLPEGYLLEPGLSGLGNYLLSPAGRYLNYDSGPGHEARLTQRAHEDARNPIGDSITPTAAEATPASQQRSSVEDVLASPTASGFNALTKPEQTDYMSRVFFSAPSDPFTTLRDHMRDLIGPEGGAHAVRASNAGGDWIGAYYGAHGDLGQRAEARNSLLNNQPPPSLSDSAISAHLAQNPGASIADVAGIQQPTAAPARTPLEQQTGMTSGPLGELPSAVRNAISARIGPHMDEREFADKYFGGMYHPDNFTPGSRGYGTGEITSTGNTLSFAGALRDPVSGENIGSINRSIHPDYAYHGYLKVDPGVRGTGAVPAMLSNQIDLYKKMGLSSVQLGANIDVGSYAWAKYGFVPKTEVDWRYLKNNMQSDWQQMKPQVDPAQADHVDRILADPDPHAIWDLADVPYKAPQGWQRRGSGDNTTIGKALLMNKSWSGKLDLNGEDSMARFNDYVKSKMK